MFVFKVYRAGAESLLAACDAELVGRTFRDGDLKIEVLEGFFGRETFPESQLAIQLRRCTIANLVGDRTVSLAIHMGLVAKDRVISIGGVPHAQIARGR